MIPRNVSGFVGLIQPSTLEKIDLGSVEDRQKIVDIFMNMTASNAVCEQNFKQFSTLLASHSGAGEFIRELGDLLGLSTAGLEENQRELAEMIYHGTLINGTDAQLQEQLPRFLELIQKVPPFSNDRELIEACRLANDPYRLREYLNRLQATMCYEEFNQYDVAGLTRPTLQLQDLKLQYSSNPSLVGKYSSLLDGDNPPLVSVQTVKGDGNCYYRSVLRSHLENAIMAGNPTRQVLFQHMATMLRGELLKEGSLYRRDHPNLESLVALVNQFEAAGRGDCWNDLQELSHDFSVEGTNGFDYILIDAMRYCMSQYLIDNLDMDLNGIMLQDVILSDMPEQDTPASEEQKNVFIQNYIKKSFLTMGKDAQGVCVNVGFLPSMISSHVNIILVSRDNSAIPEPAPQIELDPIFIDRYDMRELPRTEGNLLLRPGHYDYFNTEEQQQTKFRMLAQSPAKPFNFTGDPSLTRAWVSENEEDAELKEALALSLGSHSMLDDGDTDHETSSASSPDLCSRLDAVLDSLLVVPLSYSEAYDFRHDSTQFNSILSNIAQDTQLIQTTYQLSLEQQVRLFHALNEFVTWAGSEMKATENEEHFSEALAPLVAFSKSLKKGQDDVLLSSPTSSRIMKQRLGEIAPSAASDDAPKKSY